MRLLRGSPVDRVLSRRCASFRLLTLALVVLAAFVFPETAQGDIVEHVVAPQTTDPAISKALDDHYAVVNTTVAPQKDLFVFLPGTSGRPSDTRLILKEAAANGFRALGLMYQNDKALYAACPITNTDVNCWDKIRQEIVTGDDVSNIVSVTRADSIESRLLRLLSWLDANYPAEGWGVWIVAGRLDWRHMRLAGWSQGGAHAAYIARDREVAGVSSFSSPLDWDQRLDQAAPWEMDRHVTPVERYFGFVHLQDATAFWKWVQPIWSLIGLGLFGPPVLVDTSQSPYARSHQLTTNLPLPSVTGASFHKMTVVDAITPKEADGSPTFAPVWRALCFWKAEDVSSIGLSTWVLPSSARTPGSGGPPYTTDVTIANTGVGEATYTLKFLGHGIDGRTGPEKSLTLAAGKSATYPDVLGSLFGVSSDYGAIRLSSSSPALSLSSQTWTPSPSGGSVGQSVQGQSDTEVIRSGTVRSILAVREDGSFRTNLIVANATESPLDVNVSLVAESGTSLGTELLSLPPLGMTQVTRVVRALGISDSITGARLVLSTPTPGGAFAAYAAVIDNATSDPRTLLPK